VKQTSKFLAAAGVAAALFSTQASAALVFSGDYGVGSNSYIGLLNSVTTDSAFFQNATVGVLNPLVVGSAFANTWIFDFAPGGSATVNANFIPGSPDPNSISGFQVNLFRVTSANACSANTFSMAGTCAGILTTSFVAAGSTGGNFSNIGFTPISAGRYAFVVSGTAVSPTQYGGQLVTRNVPEPGGLALVGIALFGLAATMRKRKSA